MNIAIIPARGGSKRIPRKNIKLFHGLPVIAYAIKAAKESKVFDEVFVSTDDEEIAEVAASFGATIPWLRSKELSDDYATTVRVMKDAVNMLGSNLIGLENLLYLSRDTPIEAKLSITGAQNFRKWGLGLRILKLKGQHTTTKVFFIGNI
jgi:N-acylneuraminate cytidylyltransferase